MRFSAGSARNSGSPKHPLQVRFRPRKQARNFLVSTANVCQSSYFPLPAALLSGCSGGGGGSGSPAAVTPPTPGGTLSSASLSVNEGGEATYTVVLDSASSGNVTVIPSSDDAGAAVVSGALTFTPSNWNTPQTVTVTGVEKNDGDGHEETATVSHALNGYDSVTSAPNVPAAVQVNDAQANGIHAVSEEDRLGRVGDFDYKFGDDGEILRDGRIMELSFEHDSFATSSYGGTYTVDGDRLSGEVRGVESMLDLASLSLAAINRFESRQLSGTVVEAESARLTVTDADSGEDRFSVHYDDVHDRPSCLSLWEGTVVRDGVSVDTMTIDADGGFFRQHVNGCASYFRPSVLDPDRKLYELQDDVASCGNFDGAYTEFAYLDPLGGNDNDRSLLMATQESGTILLTTTFSRPAAMPAGDELEDDPEDDHGNTSDSATAVGLPSDTGGVLTPNYLDYFSIRVNVSWTLQVYSSGSIGTFGILEDADGTVITSDDDSGADRSFRIERELSNSLYYVRVKGNPINTPGRLHPACAPARGIARNGPRRTRCLDWTGNVRIEKSARLQRGRKQRSRFSRLATKKQTVLVEFRVDVGSQV